MSNYSFLQKKLDERIKLNALRSLKRMPNAVDFCSNDYLGIVHHDLLEDQIEHGLKTGATGSRLLSGNYALIEETEKHIAQFHEAESALIFNSGYDANVGVLSSIPQKEDTILYDQLCHASIRDGIRLSFAKSFSFLHNDINDLEKKLSKSTGNIFIVTETVFSMDGDICPLTDLIQVSKKHNANLIIDEAHAIGLIGDKGEGYVQRMNLQDDVFCRVYTFGKACGAHGAVVCGSKQLTDYLINFARSFIYTTALPENAVAAINASYNTFPFLQEERLQLKKLIEKFQSAEIQFEKLVSKTPIQIVIVPGNDVIKNLTQIFQQSNFDVRPILYPTVPEGRERLRIVLHAYNTITELNSLIKLLA